MVDGCMVRGLAPSLMIAGACAAAAVLCFVSPTRAQTADDRRCLQCHAQERIATDPVEDLRARVRLSAGEPPPPRADQSKLYVTPDMLRESVHAGVACAACHADAVELPHAARLGEVNCTSCHAAAADEYIQGVHAEAAARGMKDAPRCADCHGGHDVRRKSDPKSRTYPLNVIKVCGDCHSQHVGAAYHEGDGRLRVSQYLDSVHGRAVTKAGLIVAATCADCHGHHAIRRSDDVRSSVHHTRVPLTCGRCHVGIAESFAGSVHSEAVIREAKREAAPRAPRRRGAPAPEPSERRAPVCSDCHTSHAISRGDTPEFLSDIVGECGSCHADLYRTYRESYHGQVQRLGSERAARCSDCHGAHHILPPEDPRSTLSPTNAPDTCARCHTELKNMSAAGRANFVRYSPHADYRDRRRDPILFYVWLYFIVLMSVTFTFWGLHSIAWFARGTINRLRHGPHPRPARHSPAIQRFSTWHRVTHGLVIISFMGLTITGLPLKFSDRPWAAWLMRLLGGTDFAGYLHRTFAILVLVYLVMHVIHLWRNRRGDGASVLTRVFGPHSMLPMKRDWQEFVAMVRWFFGRGAKPTFDRWTYWEKFDYWADLVGTFIIGLSGLLLWFPTFFAEYFSGYWFNVATVVHGYEALLAVAFIFTIHFFNAHLRWEKFPVDDVIFTGQLPEEEFAEERAPQYERLKAAGTLDALRVEPAPSWQRVLAKIVAYISLTVGFSLVILIIWAGLQ